MLRLSDTQTVLLSTAAGRPDLSVLPTSDKLRLKGAPLERTLRALLTRGLIAETAAPDSAKRSKRGTNRLVITPAGLSVIGIEAEEPGAAIPAAAEGSKQEMHSEPPEERPGGTLGVLLEAVARPEGATLEDLTAASGWLPHTTRAALTRLRQRGYDVRLAMSGTRKAYHLVAAE